MDKTSIIVVLFAAHCLTLLFNIVPSGGELINFFPLETMELTFKTYLWFLLQYVYLAILYFIIWKMWELEILKYFFLLQVLLLIDFLLSYNKPIFTIFEMRMGITHLVIIIKTGLIIEMLWKSNSQR